MMRVAVDGLRVAAQSFAQARSAACSAISEHRRTFLPAAPQLMRQLFAPGADALFRLAIWSLVVGLLVAYCIAYGSFAFRLAERRRGGEGAAGAVQPQAPRRRTRSRLPLLPHDRGNRSDGRHSADMDVHDVSFADLDRIPDAGAGARQPGEKSAAALDAHQSPAVLRLFRPLDPYREGRRLLVLPWGRGSDATDLQVAARSRWSSA